MNQSPEDRWPDFVPAEDSPLWGTPNSGSQQAAQPPSHEQFAPDATSDAQRRYAHTDGEDYRQFAPPTTPASQPRQTRPQQRPDRWFNRPPSTQSMVGAVDPKQTSVTMSLVVACIIVWLLQLFVPGVNQRVALVPELVAAEPWRLLTSAFAHSTRGISHIGLNMLMLYLLGRQLEDWLGKGRFLTVYLLSALGGSACYVLLASPGTAAVGASGAIFGLFGAFFVIAVAQKQPLNSYIGLLVINIALALFSPGIAWQSHLGGAVVGAAAMGIYLWDARRMVQAQRSGKAGRSLAWPAFAGLIVIMIALMAWRLI